MNDIPAVFFEGDSVIGKYIVSNKIRTYLYGKKWYLYIKAKKGKTSCLLLQYDHNDLQDKLIVCYNPKDSLRMYTVFEDWKELGVYMEKFPHYKRNFHEVMLEFSKQKPHFDIDVDIENIGDIHCDETEEQRKTRLIRASFLVLDSLITALRSIMQILGHTINLESDIIICSSHNDVKNSFHLIVDNYYLDGYEENRTFFDMVLSEVGIISSESVKFVDTGTRKTKHNLRILGSYKAEDMRIKEYNQEYDYNEKRYIHHTNKNILQCTLVTQVEQCTHISKIREYIAPKKVYTTQNIPDTKLERYMKILADRYGDVFTYDHHDGSMILLKRLRPSLCDICKREHEHENPYMVVIDDDLFFYCRRSRGRLHLGNVETTQEDITQDDGVFTFFKEEIRENIQENRIEQLLKAARVIRDGNMRTTPKMLTYSDIWE